MQDHQERTLEQQGGGAPLVFDKRESFEKEIHPMMEEVEKKCRDMGVTFIASFVAASFPAPHIPGVTPNRINHYRHYAAQGEVRDDQVTIFSKVMAQELAIVPVPEHYAIVTVDDAPLPEDTAGVQGQSPAQEEPA